jgi:ABC-type multidrug transport system fused ATPase/permease subunit
MHLLGLCILPRVGEHRLSSEELLRGKPARLRRVDTDVNIDTIRTNLFVFTVKGLFLWLLAIFTAIRLVGLPLLGTFRIVSILLQMIVILSPLLFFLSTLPMTSKFEFRVLLGKPVVDFGAKLAVLA